MVEINNLNINEFFSLALQNQKKKNFPVAIKIYNKIIKINPKITMVYYNLGLIHEQLGDIKEAKENYYRAIKIDPNFIYSYNNLGILFQRQGLKEQAIKNFKKVIDINPKYLNAYNNLGLVYASLGKYSEALDSYLNVLNIDEKNIIATKSIIFLLTYHVSEKKHPLVNANNELRKLQTNFKFEELLKTENLNLILKKSFKIIKNESINISNLELFETQTYRRNPFDLNCERHHEVFNNSNIIPNFCFSCFKIQIEPINVVDLIRLFFIFDKLNLSRNNRRKCMVEIRNKISGSYKGLIYCSSVDEANKILKQISPLLKMLSNYKANIKRGCTEFYDSFPNYKIIDNNHKDYMNYKEEWKTTENNLEIKKNFNKIKLNNSVPGLSISDFLIINQWLNYAKVVGDLTYRTIELDLLNSKYINQQMLNQAEFRKKEFLDQLQYSPN